MVDFQALAAPFPAAHIKWRVGATNREKTKAMALAYIDARAVMERLDAVCDPDGWQNRYTHAQGTVVCEIGIKIGGEWVWKADGAGSTDVEAEKGSLSDAFKRAAVRWGIGRFLYDLPSPWVEIEPMGKSFKIKDSERWKLDKAVGGNSPPPTPQPDHHAPADADAVQRANNWAAGFLAQIKAIPTAEYVQAELNNKRAALDKLKTNHRFIHDRLMGEVQTYMEGLAA